MGGRSALILPSSDPLIRVLHEGALPQGRHELPWNGLTDKAAGLYIIRLETQAGVETRKLVVLE